MSKQWMKPLLAMLDDAGAIEIMSGGKHLKYRLPSGELFILPKTPSKPSAFDNALAELRRGLRPTNPEIANRRWNRPKPKLHPLPTSNAAEVLKPGPIIEVTAVPIQPPKETRPMNIQIDQARMSLEQVNIALASLNDQITKLKGQQDSELEKHLRLEEYIRRSEEMEKEFGEPADLGMLDKKTLNAIRYPDREQIRKMVFPHLTGDFTPRQFARIVNIVFGVAMSRTKANHWLAYEIKTNPLARRVSRGLFRIGSEIIWSQR